MNPELDVNPAEAVPPPPPPSPEPPAPPFAATASEAQVRQWAMFLHLSQLLGWLVPLAGLVVPIVLWQVKRAEMPALDAHGKAVTNWIVSSLIYGVGFGLLAIVLIGIPFVLALLLASLILPVLGALKANEGQVMNYPLAIPIFK